MNFLTQIDNLVLLSIILTSGAALFMPTLSMLIGGKGLSPTEATIWINRRKASVIDLRSEADFKAGHLPQSKNLVPADLSKGIERLKLDRQLRVLIIGIGAQNQKALKELKAIGFTEVGFLDGGVNAWKSAGLPLIK